MVEICEFGDTVIERQCAMGFKSKKIEKGVAFPTCVSINETVCHYSPFVSESIELKLGDSVKMCVRAPPVLRFALCMTFWLASLFSVASVCAVCELVLPCCVTCMVVCGMGFLAL